MQCVACGSFLSAMACNFGCPNCGYNDGWDSINNPSIGDMNNEDRETSKKDGSIREKTWSICDS